jgi:pyruvate/2-oxoglutarate dehydrogenase complex dihydrolipoamide dehydrogenase (E3) component
MDWRACTLSDDTEQSALHALLCGLQDILIGQAKFVDNHTIKYGLPGRVDVGGQVTAKDVIIATGSVPFVPPGVLSRRGTAAAVEAVQHAATAGQQQCCSCVQPGMSGDSCWSNR